jgi:hypothetical protein
MLPASVTVTVSEVTVASVQYVDPTFLVLLSIMIALCLFVGYMLHTLLLPLMLSLKFLCNNKL